MNEEGELPGEDTADTADVTPDPSAGDDITPEPDLPVINPPLFFDDFESAGASWPAPDWVASEGPGNMWLNSTPDTLGTPPHGNSGNSVAVDTSGQPGAIDTIASFTTAGGLEISVDFTIAGGPPAYNDYGSIMVRDAFSGSRRHVYPRLSPSEHDRFEVRGSGADLRVYVNDRVLLLCDQNVEALEPPGQVGG